MKLLHQAMLVNVSIENKNEDAYAAAAIADICRSNPNVSQFLPFLELSDVINKMTLNSALFSRPYYILLIVSCQVARCVVINHVISCSVN